MLVGSRMNPPDTASTAEPSSSGEVEDDPSFRLCTACGLCCDGTIFGYVPVTRDESVRLLHRLPVLAPTAKLELRVEQRCAALGVRGCDVYEVRPTACARFRCKLLKRLEARELSLGEAFEVLAPILAVVDRLDGSLPPGASFYQRRWLMPEVGPRTSPELAAILEATLEDLALLDVLLVRELLEPREDDAGSDAPG
jgi:hypothetical protein